MHFNDILFICSAIGFNMSGFIIGCLWMYYRLKKRGAQVFLSMPKYRRM